MEFKPLSQEQCFRRHIGPWCIHSLWFKQFMSQIKADMVPPVIQQAQDYIPLKNDIIPGVAQIDLLGPLAKFDSKFGGTNTLRVRQALSTASNNPNVNTIVLRIDSPGGDVAGTAELAQSIRTASQKKKVVAYIEDLGASAAYWTAAQTKEIYANPTAMIGSIGTYAVIEDTSKAFETAGIKTHVISTGALKGAGVDGTEITSEYLKEIQTIIEGINQFFLKDVSVGREMSAARVKELATGQVWLAKEAKDNGLIDRVMSWEDMLSRIAGKQKISALEQELIIASKAQDEILLNNVEAEIGNTSEQSFTGAEENNQDICEVQQ